MRDESVRRGPVHGELPPAVAVTLALLMELVLLAGITTWVKPASWSHAASPESVQLALVDPVAAPEPPTPAVSTPQPPAPPQRPSDPPRAPARPPARPVPRVSASAAARPPSVPLAPSTPNHEAGVAQAALSATAPPTSASTTAPPSEDRQAEADLAARLRAAIQAALVYPSAARDAGFQGHTRVEFVFRDGVVRNPRIIRSSGMGLTDRAALAAVENAIYPAVPPSLAGRETTYQVTVRFEMAER
jgi:protein TonB